MVFVKDKNFYKAALAICIPIAAQSLISMAVNLLDTVMLGTLGETALSASSLAGQFFFIYMIFNFGLGGGAAMISGQYWGKGDVLSVNKTLSLVQRISLLISIIFALIAAFLPEQVMRIYTPDEAVIAEGIHYLRWLIPAFLCFGVSNVTINILRSVGTVTISMVIQICTFLVNLVGNYILIFGKFGAPQMGVSGAALATSISRIFEIVFTMAYMAFKEKKIKYNFKLLFKWDKIVFKAYLNGGIAVLISDVLLALGSSMLSIIMGHMGSTMVAANSIAAVVMQITMVFNSGLSSAGAVLTSNAVGAGENEKAKAQGITLVWLSLMVGILAGIIIVVFKPVAVSFYNVTQETKDIAYQILNTMALLSPFQTMGGVLTKGVLRGGGDTRFLVVADVIFLWLLAVPLGALSGLVWKLSAGIVYAFLKCDEVIKSLWCLKRLYGNKWIRDYALEE